MLAIGNVEIEGIDVIYVAKALADDGVSPTVSEVDFLGMGDGTDIEVGSLTDVSKAVVNVTIVGMDVFFLQAT